MIKIGDTVKVDHLAGLYHVDDITKHGGIDIAQLTRVGNERVHSAVVASALKPFTPADTVKRAKKNQVDL